MNGADDKILLHGMVFYAFHGVRPAERELGQRFVVDLAVTLDLSPAGFADDLSRTADYSELYRLVSEIVTGQAFNLIETLAERIAAAVLNRFSVISVCVRVRKPEAPIPGVLDYAGVEITRHR